MTNRYHYEFTIRWGYLVITDEKKDKNTSILKTTRTTLFVQNQDANGKTIISMQWIYNVTAF